MLNKNIFENYKSKLYKDKIISSINILPSDLRRLLDDCFLYSFVKVCSLWNLRKKIIEGLI